MSGTLRRKEGLRESLDGERWKVERLEQTAIDDKSNNSRPVAAWIVHILLTVNERQCSSNI